MIPKLRVWDNEDKEMLEVHGINYDAEGIWTRETIDDEDDGNFILLSDIEIMQSTGLKDKNGVEIFEGDVIRNNYGEHGYIKWSSGGFVYHEDGANFYLFSIGAGQPFEVIGNIYEHPNLLNNRFK